MMEYKCEDCKDSKKLLTEGVILGRAIYSKEHKSVITPYVGDGNFQLTQCHCVGDE